MTITIETALTQLLDLDVPIVQAPIGGLSNPRLAAAVANAGGLGMIASTWAAPDAMRRTIRQARALTDRTFGINLILEWEQADRVEIALEEGVRLISFFWGDPSPHLERIHRAGALAALTVGSAEEGRRGADAGVDVIVAQGWEAGGHVWGEVATLPLVPAVVNAMPERPVVAAGGIGDGRGIAAVLALGAAGAWLGTRFVMSEESTALPLYQERVAVARETDTFHSSLFDGGWEDAPHRTLRNSTVQAWLDAGRPQPGSRPGEGEAVAHWSDDGEQILRYESSSPRQGVEGDIEALPMWAGQSAGLVRDVLPAGEIVARLAEETAAALTATMRGIRTQQAI